MQALLDSCPLIRRKSAPKSQEVIRFRSLGSTPVSEFRPLVLNAFGKTLGTKGRHMFENLSDRLSGVFDGLNKQATLSDEDVSLALREVRVALLEADVSLPIARDFVKAFKPRHRAKPLPNP